MIDSVWPPMDAVPYGSESFHSLHYFVQDLKGLWGARIKLSRFWLHEHPATVDIPFRYQIAYNCGMDRLIPHSLILPRPNHLVPTSISSSSGGPESRGLAK